MSKRTIKLVREGAYVVEVDVQLEETEDAWSPYLTVADAERLDAVRGALRREDVDSAAQYGRVYKLTRVAG